MTSKANYIVSVYRKNWIAGSRRLFLAEPYVRHALERSGELSEFDEVAVAPYFRATRQQLIDDHTFVDRKYQKYMPLLAARLNQIHKTRHDVYFWKKCMALGLIRYLTLFYDLFQVCEAYFDPEKHDCQALDESSYHVPRDFNDQREFFQSTAYGQEQIFSIYLHLFHPGRFSTVRDEFSWPVIMSKRHRIRAFARKLRNATLVKVRAKVVSFLAKARQPRVGIMHSFFSHRHMADLVTSSRGRIQWIPLRSHFDFPANLEREKRNVLTRPEQDFDRFDRFFFASLACCLPRMYVEGFDQVATHYQEHFHGFAKLEYVVNEPWIGDSYSSFALALLREQGVKHIYNEHNFLAHQFLRNNHRYILPLVDRFVTLGWFDESIPNLVRGGSLREWVLDKNYRKEHKIVFISGQPPIKPPEFSATYGDFGAFNAKSHLDFNMRFFRTLNTATLPEMVYRGYPTDRFVVAHLDPPMFAYDQEYVLREYMPQFKLIDNLSPSGQVLMQKARLVVIDYLSTSYIESMLADIPTVFFWNRSNYPLEDAHAEFYASLIVAGICQTDPEQAAAFVDAIKDDPESWWRRQSVQDAKNGFLARNFGDSGALKSYLLGLS